MNCPIRYFLLKFGTEIQTSLLIFIYGGNNGVNQSMLGQMFLEVQQ